VRKTGSGNLKRGIAASFSLISSISSQVSDNDGVLTKGLLESPEGVYSLCRLFGLDEDSSEIVPAC